MDSELFKLILNVREVIERNKAISFVNCRIKFNQMAQSSLIPFRQSLIFTFTPQEVNKAVEFRFDKDYREIGRITLKLDPHHLTTRFEIEKWFDLENTEPGHKISAKVSLTVQKNTIETSRSRLSLKQNNFVDVKGKDGSPRLNCLSNRLSNYVKSSHMRSPHDEQHSQISAHQSVIESNQAEYMSAPHPSLSSRNRELKLNLQSVIKGMQADMLPKSQIQSTKNRDTRHDHHASKVVAPEPQTYRDREAPEKKPASRKTKSLEKPINISALELNFKLAKMGDESNIEDSKPNSTRKSNETVRGDKPIIANLKLGRLIDDSHISHIDESRPNSTRKSGEGVKDKPIDTRMIMKKHEEDKRRVKEYAERHVEEVLRDEDTKIRRENKKYQDIIIDLERAKDKHEIESRKNAEKLEFYMEKCSNLERELHFTQNQLGLWKSKAEIIKLLESELEGLRRILKERDRNMDIERAINKKRVDFEKALKDLQEENIRYREKIGTLEDELDEITKKSHALRQEKEKVTSENILLKVRIAGLEVNEEQLRHLNAQKEEIFGEIETLRSTNKQLRELIMDQKGHIWQSNDQQSHKFAETIHKLKKKVESLSSTTITCLQTVNDHLSLNKELKNSLDEFDRMYSLDGDDSDTEIIESEESERKVRNAEAEPERPREITKHSTAESNKKPEKPVPDAKTIKRENMALGKYKSVDFNSIAAGALKIPYPTTTATLTKVRSEKSVDLTKKQPYVPIKDDPMDVKLADFINSHQEAKRLVSLIKRKSQGVYTFGSLKMCPKLENGKLFVKVGPSYLGIESFVSVHLDLEHEKLLATNIKTKKLREK